MVALDGLLRRADAVSLHAPGIPGAAAILGERELALLRPHALLINVSRASLVDHDAMLAALRGGRLGGVAMDVGRTSRGGGDAGLLAPAARDPHAAWSSARADAEYREEALASLRAALIEGREPPAGSPEMRSGGHRTAR